MLFSFKTIPAETRGLLGCQYLAIALSWLLFTPQSFAQAWKEDLHADHRDLSQGKNG